MTWTKTRPHWSLTKLQIQDQQCKTGPTSGEETALRTHSEVQSVGGKKPVTPSLSREPINYNLTGVGRKLLRRPARLGFGTPGSSRPQARGQVVITFTSQHLAGQALHARLLIQTKNA